MKGLDPVTLGSNRVVGGLGLDILMFTIHGFYLVGVNCYPGCRFIFSSLDFEMALQREFSGKAVEINEQFKRVSVVGWAE